MNIQELRDRMDAIGDCELKKIVGWVCMKSDADLVPVLLDYEERLQKLERIISEMPESNGPIIE